MTKIVHVAVGVIKREDKIFLTKRLAASHQGGKWELHQALHRELKEEVAIDTLSCTPLMQISHDYGDKKVLLDVFVVDNFTGEAKALEGQQSGWFALSEFEGLNFPAANQSIIEKLNQVYQ